MQYRTVFLFSIGFLSLAGTVPARAQQQVFQAQSGRPTPTVVMFNCTSRYGPPTDLSGTALNGTVVTRQMVLPRCGNPQQPVQALIYTSKPGFKGQDELFVYGMAGMNRWKIIVQ